MGMQDECLHIREREAERLVRELFECIVPVINLVLFVFRVKMMQFFRVLFMHLFLLFRG